MFSVTSRAGIAAAALTLALAACSEQMAPSQSTAERTPVMRLGIGGEIVVTNTSGGTNAGSLRWALAATEGGETIRFDPSIAGQSITPDSALHIRHFVTIEGPADKGITLLGAKKRSFIKIDSGATLRNLVIAHAGDSVAAAGAIDSHGRLRLEHVTLWNNQADMASAVLGDDITLVNSTVSGNHDGHAIVWRDTLTLINSTVVYNHGRSGLIPLVTTSPLRLRNSIVVANGTPLQNCHSGTKTVVYMGNNLSDDGTCGSAGDLMIVANAKLNGFSGDPTPGWALQPTSPAINAGKDCTVAVDQSYVPRDAKCDIGSREFTDFTVVALTIDPETSLDPATGAVTVTGTIACSREESISVAASLKQAQGSPRASAIVQGAATTPVACVPTPTAWSAMVPPASGSFQLGTAEASAATANAGAWITPAAASAPVKVLRAKK
jgi:hypothetical protein